MSFLQLLGKLLPSGTLYMCFYHMKARHKTSLLTATRKLENIFPPFPSLWLHFHFPDGGCALTFAAINLLVYLDFPSLMCLNELNATLVAKFIPNWNCHYWVSQRNRTTQSETPPTAITDSIILSKGTWSINDIHLILSSINSSKRSLKFKHYGNVTVFEECLYSTFFIFMINYSRTVGNSNHRPLSCYF